MPIGGVFTMDERQAALACKLLDAKATIPMHWGTFPVLAKNTESFKEELINHAQGCELLNVAVGESLALEKAN